jgi:hypothetical protein
MTYHYWYFFDVAERLRPFSQESTPRVTSFECGVVAIEFRVPEARRRLEVEAEALMKDVAKDFASHFEAPYAEWIREEYCLVHAVEGELTPAEIARFVRGEERALSASEVQEIIGGAVMYYTGDRLVAGWAGAYVEGSLEPACELLRYANVQLLEFRRYDAQLTAVLANAYAGLRAFRRWSLRGKAQGLYRILLHIRESTERMDNAVKFLSDTYAARVYRLAASRVGVDDYRRLVESKWNTAQEVYRFMLDQFHHTRAFVLEFLVVAILVIDLYYLLVKQVAP